jgi:hypothetical protein
MNINISLFNVNTNANGNTLFLSSIYLFIYPIWFDVIELSFTRSNNYSSSYDKLLLFKMSG